MASEGHGGRLLRGVGVAGPEPWPWGGTQGCELGSVGLDLTWGARDKRSWGSKM